MNEHESSSRHLVEQGGRLFGHVAAIVVGFVMMILAIAMGVTMVLLPLGIPLGLVGLMTFLWGLFGWTRTTRT